MRLLILLLAIASTMGTKLLATTVNWTGNVSTDWSDPNNWDCTCLPGIDNDVSIPIGSFVDLADDADVQIRSLAVRGNLFIEDGSRLLINSQAVPSTDGLLIAVGVVTNTGELIIDNVVGATAVYVNEAAELNNNGVLHIGPVSCNDSSCSSQDALVVDGTMVNTGQLQLDGVLNMDGITIRGMLSNAGMIQLDMIRTNGSVLAVSQLASFVNAEDGVIQFSGIEGGNVSRVFSSSLDSISWENAGAIRVDINDNTTTAMSIGGDGSTVLNTGTIEVDGGGDGISLGAPERFVNRGEIHLWGQQKKGLILRGAMVFENEGQITMRNGAVQEGIQLTGSSPGPQLQNRGTIVLEDYLLANTFSRGLKATIGEIVNEGLLYMVGANDGRGMEIEAAAVPLDNREAGTIYLNNFDFGLQLAATATNAGTMILASGLGDAILDNDIPLVNTGTLAGGSIYRQGVYELTATSVLSPGTDSTTARQTFADDLILAESVVINLDLASTLAEPDAYDNIRNSRAFQFSGTLNVRLTDDFAVNSGSFDLLRGSGSAGGFTGTPTINLPDPPTGSSWRLEQTSTKLILHLDVINDTDVLTEEDPSVSVFPNPVSTEGELMVQVSENQLVGRLYAVSGQLVSTEQLYRGENKLSLYGLPAGYYLFVVGEDRIPIVIQ